MQPDESGSPRVEESGGAVALLRDNVADAVSAVLVGLEQGVDSVLVAMLCGGHVLLEGVPGVAKTLLAASVARACAATFRRIQFTPDMLPSDVTGNVTLLDGTLRFAPGPIFANLVLADEINRTPPKTQAALLEAMQEAQVSVAGDTHLLPQPFVVIATQNPIDYEGTYPLPEAQLDRFMMKVDLGYPSAGDEEELLRRARRGVSAPDLSAVGEVVRLGHLAAARDQVDATAVSDEVIAYVSAIVRRTRELPAVSLGASPRAGVHLLAASRAQARLAGREFVTPDDVVDMAVPVLAHRLVLRPEAELERYRPADLVQTAVAGVAVPR
jgi:MoxR-like ATPase